MISLGLLIFIVFFLMLNIKPNLFLLVTESSYFGMKLLGVTRISKYLRYEVKQIFVFCTFRRNAMFVSKCLGMFFGVKLFAYGYISLLLIYIRSLRL